MDMEGQTFQQRWDFRRKDDEADSTSDDSTSKSSSGDDPAGKKLMIVPFLGASDHEEEEATDDLLQISQQKSQVHPRKATHSHQTGSGKERNGADKKSKPNCGEKRKRKREVNHHPATTDPDLAVLGDLKSFTDSLLEEIKVARKKMLVKMRRQMMKLVSAKPVPNQRKRRCVAKKPESTGNKSGGRSRRGKADQTCPVAVAVGVTKGGRRSHGKAKAAKKDGDGRSSARKKPLQLPPNATDSDHPSLCGLVQSGISGTNAIVMNAENKAENHHYSYLLDHPQPDDEQLRNGGQITSRDMVFMDQQQSSQTSSRLSVLPVPFGPTPWSNDGLKIVSLSVVERSAREEENHRKMGFARRSHARPECFEASSMDYGYGNSRGRFESFSCEERN